MIKTEKENLIEVRNKTSIRYTEARANISYWKIVFKDSKKNSQEKVDANSNIAINQTNMRKDKIFLECIDKLIAGEK